MISPFLKNVKMYGDDPPRDIEFLSRTYCFIIFKSSEAFLGAYPPMSLLK